MKAVWYLLLLYLSPSVFAQSEKEGKDFSKNLDARLKGMVGKPFPPFLVKTGGSVLSNKDFAGKTVFVNFWFEACTPCVAEFEGLNELYSKLKDSTGFAFVAFSYETPEKCKELRAKYDLQYPVVSVSVEECYRLNQGFGFPTNVILDSNGIIRFFECGGSIKKQEATEHLMTAAYPKIIEVLQTNQ